jgi:hypothetical protein
MINKNIKFNKGYTLLFAVIVSTLVLSVGISILNISKKEFLLSSSARESTKAFYAADSGLECAVYHDFIKNSFINPPREINCNGQTIRPTRDVNKYSFDLHLGGDLCAKITVIKDPLYTDFYSRGYNLGWGKVGVSTVNTCDLPSPRRLERAIGYRYAYLE